MRHTDEAIAAIADALIYAYSDAVLCGSCRWADEMKDRAEFVLDGLRAAGFELRPRSADPPTCPECAEVVHDADCPLVGDGRPVDKEESHV